MNRFVELIESLNGSAARDVMSVATQRTQQQVLDDARLGGRSRVQQAYLRLNGTHPTHGQTWRQEGLRKAKALIDRSISNIDEVVDKLDRMHTVLSSAQRFTTQHDPASCQMRGAYYDAGDRKIHVCPAFFTTTDEERIRTMIHEAAHAVGIGQSGGESYLAVYDCNSSFDDKNVADGWAHFVHCLLGLPVDPPNVIRGGGGGGGNGSSGSKSLGWSRATEAAVKEVAVSPDEFVLDILEFFFEQRLDVQDLNDELRDIAAQMLWTATRASRQMDLVPRPPAGRASVSWLVSEAVQIAYRRATNRGIYESVRVATARNFRSAYEIARMTGGSLSMRWSRAAGAVDYMVPGIIPEIAQPSSMSCWATTYTMLYSWKHQVSRPIESVLEDLGQKWLDMFRNNTGLPAAETANFINAAGLESQPAMSPSVEGWEDMLRNYGPLVLTTNEAPGKRWIIHARVLIGIRGDGTADGTRFTIIDPAGGRKYEETLATFIPKYHDEVIRTGYMRIQIMHWPAQAGASLSFGDGHHGAVAMGAVKFHVKDVPDIKQPTDNTCWAAATTMLFAWYRGNRNLRIRAFLDELADKTYVNLFDTDTAVSREQEKKLYELLGLETIDQFNPTIEAWEGYLRDFGPLSVTIKYEGTSLVHAVVVTGIEGDGTAAGTKVYLHDPLNDAASRLPSPITFERFLASYEGGAGWPMQIIHFRRGSDMVSEQSAWRRSRSFDIEMPPLEVTVSSARREAILRRAGWRQGTLTATVLNFRGEPLLGHRLFAEFQAADVEPQTYAQDVRGGTAIFSRVWMKPSGTMRLIAVSTGTPSDAPSGVVHYTLPASNQLRVEARQQHDDVEVTATNSQEAARKAGATGTAGINFEVFEIGGEVSTEESRTRGSSHSRRYTVRIPTSTLQIRVL